MHQKKMSLTEKLLDELDELESSLCEARVVRSKRVSSMVRQKRKRYYRKRRSKIKRQQKRYRRKPKTKRLAKRRAKIKKRLHIKPHSRRRLKLVNSTEKTLGGKSMNRELREINTALKSIQNNKQDLIQGFTESIKLSRHLQKNFAPLYESKVLAHKKSSLNESQEIIEVPEFFDPFTDLPEFKDSSSVHLDEDFQKILSHELKPSRVLNESKKGDVLNLEVKKTIQALSEDFKRLERDATQLMASLKNGSISESEAHDALEQMVEFLHQSESLISEDDEEDNWDQEEFLRWVLNDEGMYRQARRFKSPRDVENFIEDYKDFFTEKGIDLNKVDAHEVYDDIKIDESLSEEITDKGLDSYLECALWMATENGEELDSKYSIHDFAPEAKKKAQKDFRSFLKKAGDLLHGYDLTSVGHDFWLTRNDHGAGFWDGDYDEEDGEKLTQIAESFGPQDLYVGDDGKLYLDGGTNESLSESEEDQVLKVLNLMHDEEVDPEYASPNFVKDFADHRNIKLSSDEVVMISDYFGTNDDPSGRSKVKDKDLDEAQSSYDQLTLQFGRSLNEGESEQMSEFLGKYGDVEAQGYDEEDGLDTFTVQLKKSIPSVQTFKSDLKEYFHDEIDTDLELVDLWITKKDGEERNESISEAKKDKWCIIDWAGNYAFEKGGYQGSGHLHSPINTFNSFEDAEEFLDRKLEGQDEEERGEFHIVKVSDVYQKESVSEEKEEEVTEAGKTNALSKLKGDHKKAVQMAIEQLKKDGYGLQAKKIESGTWDLKKAGDWAEDINYHGLASVFRNEPGTDHRVIMKGEERHNAIDQGEGSQLDNEEYPNERKGALDAKYEAANTLQHLDDEDVNDQYSGTKKRKLNTLTFLDHHELQDSKTFKDVMDHIKRHPEDYKKYIKDYIQNLEKYKNELDDDSDQERFKKYYDGQIDKLKEVAKKYGLDDSISEAKDSKGSKDDSDEEDDDFNDGDELVIDFKADDLDDECQCPNSDEDDRQADSDDDLKDDEDDSEDQSEEDDEEDDDGDDDNDPSPKKKIKDHEKLEDSKLSEAKKTPEQKKREKKQELLNQLHALKLSDHFDKKEVDHIVNGYPVPKHIDGEVHREDGVGGYEDEYQETLVDQIIENKEKGVFEAGFKYLQLKDGQAWLKKNGFTMDRDSIDPRYHPSKVKDPYFAEKHWINPKTKVIITGNPEQFGEGGYSGVYGPAKEGKATFEKLLKDAVYLKDLNVYKNGLGGKINHEQYQELIQNKHQGKGPKDPTDESKKKNRKLKEAFNPDYKPKAHSMPDHDPTYKPFKDGDRVSSPEGKKGTVKYATSKGTWIELDKDKLSGRNPVYSDELKKYKKVDEESLSEIDSFLKESSLELELWESQIPQLKKKRMKEVVLRLPGRDAVTFQICDQLLKKYKSISQIDDDGRIIIHSSSESEIKKIKKDIEELTGQSVSIDESVQELSESESEDFSKNGSDEPFWSIYLDKDISHKDFSALEKAINDRAPEWGEYELGDFGEGINLNGVHSPSHFKYHKEALKFAEGFLKERGYKTEIAESKKEESISESESEPVSMKEFKEALKAHNSGKEKAVFNDGYNKEHKLGTYAGRSLVTQIANFKSGDSNDKVSIEDAIVWAQSQIISEVNPIYKPLIKELSSQYSQQTKLSVRHKEESLSEDSVKKIKHFEIEDIGEEHPDYFQGRGTSFTKWDEAIVGIGDSPYGAGQDALEQLANMGYDLPEDLELEAKGLSKVTDPESEDHETFFYVAIYVQDEMKKEESLSESENDDLKRAEQLGREAFQKGKNRVPMTDSKLKIFLKVKGGKVQPLLQSWLKGWDEESLVDEPGDETFSKRVHAEESHSEESEDTQVKVTCLFMRIDPDGEEKEIESTDFEALTPQVEEALLDTLRPYRMKNYEVDSVSGNRIDLKSEEVEINGKFVICYIEMVCPTKEIKEALLKELKKKVNESWPEEDAFTDQQDNSLSEDEHSVEIKKFKTTLENFLNQKIPEYSLEPHEEGFVLKLGDIKSHDQNSDMSQSYEDLKDELSEFFYDLKKNKTYQTLAPNWEAYDQDDLLIITDPEYDESGFYLDQNEPSLSEKEYDELEEVKKKVKYQKLRDDLVSFNPNDLPHSISEVLLSNEIKEPQQIPSDTKGLIVYYKGSYQTAPWSAFIFKLNEKGWSWVRDVTVSSNYTSTQHLKIESTSYMQWHNELVYETKLSSYNEFEKGSFPTQDYEFEVEESKDPLKVNSKQKSEDPLEELDLTFTPNQLKQRESELVQKRNQYSIFKSHKGFHWVSEKGKKSDAFFKTKEEADEDAKGNLFYESEGHSRFEVEIEKNGSKKTVKMSKAELMDYYQIYFSDSYMGIENDKNINIRSMENPEFSILIQTNSIKEAKQLLEYLRGNTNDQTYDFPKGIDESLKSLDPSMIRIMESQDQTVLPMKPIQKQSGMDQIIHSGPRTSLDREMEEFAHFKG